MSNISCSSLANINQAPELGVKVTKIIVFYTCWKVLEDGDCVSGGWLQWRRVCLLRSHSLLSRPLLTGWLLKEGIPGMARWCSDKTVKLLLSTFQQQIIHSTHSQQSNKNLIHTVITGERRNAGISKKYTKPKQNFYKRKYTCAHLNQAPFKKSVFIFSWIQPL